MNNQRGGEVQRFSSNEPQAGKKEEGRLHRNMPHAIHIDTGYTVTGHTTCHQVAFSISRSRRVLR